MRTEDLETEPAPTPPPESEAIAERYGRSTRARRTDRRLLTILGGTIAAVLVAWVAWAGLDSAGANLETAERGYTIVDDGAIDVRFAVSVPAGTPTRCVVQALNEQFAIIGWKVIDLPAADTHTTAHQERVRTTQRANTGLIYRCWLP